MRAYMSTRGYDALAFSTPDWFEWAGNHAVRELAWERPFLLVVPIEGPSFAFLSEQSRHLADLEARHGSLWIESVVHYAESNCEGHKGWQVTKWPQMVADTLTQRHLQRARIGVDSLSAVLGEVARLLPGLEVQPCGESLRSLRWVKHREELETMRIAAGLTDWAMKAYRAEIRPGRLLAEMDYVVGAKLAVEAARRIPGENYVISRMVTLSGTSSACPQGDDSPTSKCVESDAIAITTIATRLNGLAMECARPWLVGTPPLEAIELFDCVSRAQAAAMTAAVATQPVSGIQRAAERVFEGTRWCDWFRLRAGHGIGVVLHDFPQDMAFVGRPLEKDETYAVEPGIYMPHLGGMRFSDTVIIGTEGVDELTTAPKDRRSQTID